MSDNTGGILMQRGEVDMCIVGTDRTSRNGDVANKIGTYLKALAAFDNQIPFFVAAPSSSIDFSMTDGMKNIPIEERSPDEVRFTWGWSDDGTFMRVRTVPEETPGRNPAFDVTQAYLVTGIITEKGVVSATVAGIASVARS